MLLLGHFRAYYAQQIKQAPFDLDAEALQCWERYSFPGNIRELRNIVIRLITKYPGRTVDATRLRDELEPLETSASKEQMPDCPLRQTQDSLRTGNFNLDN